ncbi:MAG: hypothetical protein CMF22_12645 [Idiomarinaceae bacterium]|nr:hypothetical protein [Idiomarinaceae bacterium]MBG24284.1 hypothetical protein [Idiomarinaceae bacterium]
MILITNSHELRRIIRSQLELSSSVVALSAYVTYSGVEWLLKKLSKDAKLTIVGRFAPQDFLNGASDTKGIRLLLDEGHEVKVLQQLHAKVTLFDNRFMLVGSANCTGKGYGLFEAGNVEATVGFDIKDETSTESTLSIVKSATPLTLDILDRIDDYLAHQAKPMKTELPRNWPLDVLFRTSGLFVVDLPLCPPLVECEHYKKNRDIEFAAIQELRGNYEIAKAKFKSSKIYIWLMSQIENCDDVNGLSFGQVSSLLHNALLDDPSPYRRTVKDLQANLYKYAEIYAADDIYIYKLGQRSQFIRKH